MAQTHTIPQFVHRLRASHRWWSLGLAALGHALVGGVVLCLVDLLVPGLIGWALLAVVLWLVAVCVWTAARVRLPLRQADRVLGLRDRLLTYLGLQRTRSARSPAFAAWLEQDLEHRLAAIPDADTAGLWRRPLGNLRYLVPLLLLLLLLREFAPFPTRPGDRGPTLSTNSQAGGGDASPDEGAGNQDNDSAPPDQPTPSPRALPDTPPPPPPAPEPSPEEPELAAAPSLEFEVDVVDRFVIPHYIGEGETRKQMTKLALLGAGDGGGESPRPPTETAPQAPPPPRDVTEYQKAYERALRSRHVPARERPFVRTYFEALLEAVR